MQKNLRNHEVGKKLKKLLDPQATKNAKPIFLRDPKRNETKLHVLTPAVAEADAELEIPRIYTEVIGWHAGKEVVQLKKIPHC